MKSLLQCLALFFLLSCAIGLNAQGPVYPSFYGAKSPFLTSSSVLQDGELRASADINNDGNLDLIGVWGSSVQILYMDGAGSFIADTFYYIGLNDPNDCDTADLNHDGFEDIVGITEGSFGPENEVFILMSDSNGVFTMTYIADHGGWGSEELALGDFDNDGFVDVAIADGANQNMPLLYGNAGYTFDTYMLVTIGGSGWVDRITRADFNNDGYDDIALSFGYGFRYEILVSDTLQGAFQVNSYTTSGPVFGIDAADFNHDGCVDLAFSYANVSGQGVMVIPGICDGTFSLSLATYYYIGHTEAIGDVEIPDIDSDSYADIVVTYGAASHRILMNNGNGQFTLTYRGAGGYNPQYADFNNDGTLDLISNSGGGIRQYCFANGDGSGQLPLAPKFDGAVQGYVEGGDFTGDGFGDVLTYSTLNDSIRLCKGAANGTLTPSWSIGAPVDNNVATADFNNDGKLDFATYIASTSTIRVYRANTIGGFYSSSYTATGASVNYSWITSADFNLDGHADIAYGYGGSSVTTTYGIMLSNGSGGFNAPVTYPATSGNGFRIIEAGLVNLDNIPDLVIKHFGASVTVLLGIGNGTFSPQTYTTPHSQGMQLVITNVDYDPYPDICLNHGSYLDVLYGNSSATFPTGNSYANSNNDCEKALWADWNGDWLTDFIIGNTVRGVMDIRLGDGNRNFSFPDTSYLMGPQSNFPIDICATDVNGDGLMDIVDGYLIVFINTTAGIIITSDNTTHSSSQSDRLSVYPNPAIDQTILQLTSDSNGEAQMRILSLDGKAVQHFSVPVATGENNIPLNLQGLPSGVYIIEARAGDKYWSERLVVD